MSNDFLVVFSADNARIINGIAAGTFSGAKNIAVNPDLSVVAGIAPHYWKLEGDKVVAMSPSEQNARDEMHSKLPSAPASDTHALVAKLVKKNLYFRIAELALVAICALYFLVRHL